jgi:hypothetical protein
MTLIEQANRCLRTVGYAAALMMRVDVPECGALANPAVAEPLAGGRFAAVCATVAV